MNDDYNVYRKKVMQIVDAMKGEFTLQELIEKADLDDDQARLRDLLDVSGLAFTKDGSIFTPAADFFQGGTLLLSPTMEELENGVLLPGDRFIPFHLHTKYPNEIKLFRKEGGYCKRKPIVWSIHDAYIFYMLFGYHHYFEYLIREDEQNMEALESVDGSTDVLIRLSAFDMGRFYEKHNFQPDDYIQCRVRNYHEALFDFTYFPAEKVDDLRIKKWITLMDEGFEKSFSYLKIPVDPVLQIAYGYFFAGKEAVTNPALHFGGYLEKSSAVAIHDFGNKTFIWREGEDVGEALFRREKTVAMTGTTESLDAILDDVGSALTPSIIEAYMRNTLYKGQKLNDAVSKMMNRSNTSFVSFDQSETFMDILEEMWSKLSHNFSPKIEKKVGPLREKALSIVDNHLSWIRKLDRKKVLPEQLPREEMVQLIEGIHVVENLLDHLNEPEQVVEDIEHFSIETIEQMVEITDEIHTSIEEKLLRNNALQTSSFVYVLKVSLKDIRPPIWRRLQIPGILTLEELHYVIQDAFGWDNYHLHSFLKGGTEYTDHAMVEDDVFEDSEDESDFCLDDFSLREKDRFDYVYDFGDNWRHTILVEKVVPHDDIPPDTRNTVVCLKGKRSAPPEDCGGPWGYEGLVELLQEPKDRLDEEDRSLLEWAGDFDPDHFDVDEVNAKLRRY